MTLKNRITAWTKLGVFLNEQLHSESAEFTDVLKRASQENAWFTEANIRFAFQSIVEDLNEENLEDWIQHYPFWEFGLSPKTIAVIMAGNLPMVGFRDMLCVLISGHKIVCKLSSKDQILPRYLAQKLIEIEPNFSKYISFEDSIIKGFDAIIATGGHQATEHFSQYFQNYPHIIRGHRNSVAILENTENTDDLKGLFNDMFVYFGLGCRNVTKLFVPQNYDFQQLTDVVKHEKTLIQQLSQHHLYQNNFQYQSVVSALSGRKTVDCGVFTLIEDSSLTPPISVVHYEFYSDINDVRNLLKEQQNQIQCVVSKSDIPFGNAQKPTLFDYADNIDTMNFLNNDDFFEQF